MNQDAERAITNGFLRHMAENSESKVLREFAGEVLRGRISLADGLAFEGYSDALSPTLKEFAQWYDTLSNDEREREAMNCATRLKEIESQLNGDPLKSKHA
jgi:hypothetical protein